MQLLEASKAVNHNVMSVNNLCKCPVVNRQKIKLQLTHLQFPVFVRMVIIGMAIQEEAGHMLV